jgi:hypothetical protein
MIDTRQWSVIYNAASSLVTAEFPFAKDINMQRFLVPFLSAAALIALGPATHAEEQAPNHVQLKGQVVILKEASTKPVGPIDPGSLIIADIPDSGSRPPQDIKVDGTTCISLGHVRGVATNKEGQSLMGGGYTWYLFQAPSGPKSTHVKVSYTPNGGGKPIERNHQIDLNAPKE